jgi:hypothetical protein
MSYSAKRNRLRLVAVIVVVYTAWSLTHAHYWSACFGATALASSFISQHTEQGAKPWKHRILNLLTLVFLVLGAVALINGVG